MGCLIDKIYPRIAKAFVDICDHHGIGLFIPEGQGCCGIPALSAGDSDTFQRLVRHNLDRIRQQSFDYLVTACATCTVTIKELWPPMLRDGLGIIAGPGRLTGRKNFRCHSVYGRQG